MEVMTDAELIGELDSEDYRACDRAATGIFEAGERMIGPLLMLRGRKQPYAGTLGNPRGSMTTIKPRAGSELSPEQSERVVTVEAAALYLISAIYAGRMDFASSALLTDLELPAEKRKAANNSALLERGFTSASKWSESVAQDGLKALQERGEGPLKQARLAFW